LFGKKRRKVGGGGWWFLVGGVGGGVLGGEGIKSEKGEGKRLNLGGREVVDREPSLLGKRRRRRRVVDEKTRCSRSTLEKGTRGGREGSVLGRGQGKIRKTQRKEDESVGTGGS